MAKKRRILSTFLAACMVTSSMVGMSVTASADGDTSYTITIPSSLTVANSGWNSIGNISASGTLADGKKLTVSAESANSWALKSGDNTVSYTLNNGSDTKGDAATSWEFTTLPATQAIGIDVADYSSKPAGTYTDTVTFTAKVENAVTTRTVTFNTDTDGKTINKDGVTCSRGFDSYNNLFGDNSGFSVSSGQFTKIEVTANDVSMIGMDQMTMNTIEGWSTTSGTATWTGKSSTVPFGVIMGNRRSVTIVFTIEE